MMYSNFTDKPYHKVIIIFLYFMSSVVVIASASGMVLLSLLYCNGERSWIVLILPLLPILSLVYCASYMIWILRKVSFSKEGIHVQSIWGRKKYAWNSVEEYGVFSISLFTNSNLTPYFLFIISEPKLIRRRCTNLSTCFFYKKKVIPVLYTNERNQIVEDLLKQKTNIYDWNMNQGIYEWKQNRSRGTPPRSPYPKWQEYEEKKRKSASDGEEGTVNASKEGVRP